MIIYTKNLTEQQIKEYLADDNYVPLYDKEIKTLVVAFEKVGIWQKADDKNLAGMATSDADSDDDSSDDTFTY